MTYCSVAAVLVLVGLTKKRVGHYAILKILSLRSPSTFLLYIVLIMLQVKPMMFLWHFTLRLSF